MTASAQSKLKPALIGGASLAVASSVPYLEYANACCCALAIGGGVLAAYLYMKDAEPSAQAPLGPGFLLGGLTGLFGAVLGTLIAIPMNLLTSSEDRSREVIESLESAGAELPPEFIDIIVSLASGGMASIVLSFIVTLVLFPVFAGIGSLIGVAIFNKKPTATV